MKLEVVQGHGTWNSKSTCYIHVARIFPYNQKLSIKAWSHLIHFGGP